MHRRNWMVWSLPLLVVFGTAFTAPAWGDEPVGEPGEKLGPDAIGPVVVEEWEDGVVRDLLAPPRATHKVHQGQQGRWRIPSRRQAFYPHSGKLYAFNEWGDTRMGIGFPQTVDVHGAYFAGQAGEGVWAEGIRVIGYRDGEVVGQTAWFTDIGREPKWFAMGLDGVDRIVIEAVPVVNGAGWYGLDDLTYSIHSDDAATAEEMTVVSFEDLGYGVVLTGSNYAGLTWEEGHGDFDGFATIHKPQVAPGAQGTQPPANLAPEPENPLGGTPPTIELNWEAGDLGDGNALPPDTMGAIGTYHYVETLNQIIMIYDRNNGQLFSKVSIPSFFNISGTIGDPRVIFDHYMERWVIISTTFDFGSNARRIYFAVSRTANPTFGGWLKSYIQTNQGVDVNRWPDFPTLGYDDNGYYITAFMVQGVNSAMTIWALEKAPLVANPPQVGTITAWRNRPFEWAIQPAHTLGAPGREYLISRSSDTGFRIRRIEPPLTAPLLYEMGNVAVPLHYESPNAPALGSTTPIDSQDPRLNELLYRDGYLWTVQEVYYNGLAAIRWYQINPLSSPMQLVQYGTISTPGMYYYYPSINVNSRGDVALGFSGSNGQQYVACYVTGRVATDPPGEVAEPILLKAGEAAYTILDNSGRNRWGDYSAVRVDALDDTTFWTVQEYAKSPTNTWGTWVAKLTFPSGPEEEACCYPSGMCGDELPANCTANGGDPQGSGTACASFDCPPCPGDLDCSGDVSFADINPFVLALTDPNGWQQQNPGCPVLNGDINNDQVVDFGDINPFVNLLSQGGGNPQPCAK